MTLWALDQLLMIADRMSPDQIENAVWGIEDSHTPGT